MHIDSVMASRGKEQDVDSDGHVFDLREQLCPTCGLKATRTVGLRGGKSHRYGLGIASRIVACGRCGLLFPDPFPRPRDPQELYGDPEKYFVTNQLAKEGHARALVDQMLARLNLRAPSILDVGSGRGEFLHFASEGGAEAVGLELSTAMIEEARRRYGVTVLPQTIEQFAATTDRQFDLVVLGAVLEHVYDPDSMIACCKKLVRAGGRLYVDVPRDPNLLTLAGNFVNRLRRSPTVYNLSPTFSPYHVFGFTPRSLGVLLAKHSFVVESTVVWSSPNVPWRKDAGFGDRIRARAATEINRLANFLNLASNMFVWARKGQ